MISRGFTLDEADRKYGLLQLAEGLKEFRPALAALEALGMYSVDQLRTALGTVANRVKAKTVADRGNGGRSAYTASWEVSRGRKGRGKGVKAATKALAAAVGP